MPRLKSKIREVFSANVWYTVRSRHVWRRMCPQRSGVAALRTLTPGTFTRETRCNVIHVCYIGGRNMSSLFEGRESDSPYIEAVWRGRAGSDYAPVCPASNRWHLLFLRQNGRVNVAVEVPLTKATPVTQAEGT